MTSAVVAISWDGLLIAALPALLVFMILWRWAMPIKDSAYALVRMLAQLLLIGYFLTYLFHADSHWLVVLVLVTMVSVSSWIALRVVAKDRISLLVYALAAVGVSGSLMLWVITQGVLQLDPWYKPQYMIPLAGMIFSSAMNSVSLSAERFFAERARQLSYLEARTISFQAAMIPMVNALFAVGLVSLPGMMTGQILSGISPLVAARYQIIVMLMLFAVTGIASALFLYWLQGWERQRAKGEK